MPSNQDQFDVLQDQYGSKEAIPNDVLYEFLQSIRQDLINMAKLGSDHIPNSSLGKEVRRRSKIGPAVASQVVHLGDQPA